MSQVVYKVYVMDVVNKEQAKRASMLQKQIRKLTGMMVIRHDGQDIRYQIKLIFEAKGVSVTERLTERHV